MPSSAPRACTEIGCSALVAHGGRCEAHKRQAARRYDATRGTPDARGYGRRWQDYSKAFRRQHPLCEQCLRDGRTTASQCVDHIAPVQGAADPAFWQHDNHQALCNSCHATKTAAEDGGFGNESNS